MRTVEFKFDLDQKVKTPFGEPGFITMLGFDDGGPQYYVATKSGETSRWFKEQMLTADEAS